MRGCGCDGGCAGKTCLKKAGVVVHQVAQAVLSSAKGSRSGVLQQSLEGEPLLRHTQKRGMPAAMRRDVLVAAQEQEALGVAWFGGGAAARAGTESELAGVGSRQRHKDKRRAGRWR